MDSPNRSFASGVVAPWKAWTNSIKLAIAANTLGNRSHFAIEFNATTAPENFFVRFLRLNQLHNQKGRAA